MKAKIMMISDHASPLTALGSVDSGGQNIYVANLSKSLALLGFQVDIFTRKTSSLVPAIINYCPNVRVINIKAGPEQYIPKEQLLAYMDEFAEACIHWCQRESYDIIHANFFMSGVVAAKVKLACRIPLVITFHALGKVRRMHQGAADGFPDSRFSIEEKLIQEAADFTIAECPQDQEDLINLYGADPQKLFMAPCGIDSDLFFPQSKSQSRLRLGIHPDTQVILQLGRLVPRKGVDDVIRATALLSKARQNKNKDVELFIVGGDTYTPSSSQSAETARLIDLAKKTGIANRIRFIGRRNPHSLRIFYCAADIFVSVPWYEPFGITPLEAMACGTPIIGSAVGGIKYSISDGITGLLVPPKNPAEIARKIEFLFRRPELRQNLSRQGRQRVMQFFTWEKVASQISSLYCKAIAEHRARHLTKATPAGFLRAA